MLGISILFFWFVAGGERCGGEKNHVDSTVSKTQQSQKPKSGGAFPPAAHGVHRYHLYQPASTASGSARGARRRRGWGISELHVAVGSF